MHYYTFNIGDYMRDTAHLDEMEDLAYRRMLDLYYLKEMPLPASVQDIAKLIRMRTHSESIANVLREFFTLTNNGYINNKADETLSKIYDKSAKAKESAKKRWENQQVKNANALQTDSERNANGMLPINPLPNNLLTQTNIVDSVESPIKKPKKRKNNFEPSSNETYSKKCFDIFWDTVERRRTGKVEALKAFEQYTIGKTEDEVDFILSVICHWYDLYLKEDEARLLPENKKYIKSASAWLNSAPWRADKNAYLEFKKEYYGETDES